MSPPASPVDAEILREFELESLRQASTPKLGYGFELQRREFFKLLGGGLLVGMCVSALAQESGGGGGRESEEDLPKSLAAWLHVAENGEVTVYTGKVEVGQNIRTSLSQQVAEELRVPMESIQLVMADTALTPFDMGTFGSRTTPIMGPQLRNVAATAREALISLAAARWHIAPDTLVAAEGKITDSRTRRSITYGELSRGQELLTLIGEGPSLLSPKDWKIAGTSAPKVDGRAFVTGQHKYTPDMARPGMLVGKVVRPAAFKASLTSFDAAEAKKIPAVTVVHDGDFVGVAAPDEPTAARAVKALQAQWKAAPQTSDATLFADLRKPPAESTETHGDSGHVAGSVEQGLASADKTLAQTYTVAYIAHAPLEPRAALAEWTDGKLTVWTGTQRPFAVRDELAQAFRLPAASVRVIVPDTGSAYGGKHTGEAAVEAARLAKAAGKPVKLVWTREEEFTWAYFRPAGVIDVKSGVCKDGTVVAWQFDNYNSGPSAIRTPYNIANQKIEFHPSDAPLRQGSYRGLAATANHFARETHMDELAHLLGMDPLEFRLKNIADPRLTAVFQAAAQKFGWGRERNSATRGCGIAGGVEKGGYIAACAEVEIDPGSREVEVRRIVAAFECGAIVNPNGLRNQIMGSVVQGLGGALFEAVGFNDGKITNPHFAQYRVPRFADTPRVEVEMLDRKDLPPAGAGETPIVGAAPAVGNAIFAATGIRLRSLPLAPNGVPKTS
jgi:isoquinoline 1-oxidoreductase